MPDYPIHRCLVSRSSDTGMLIVVGTRKRPDGNVKAMFLLLDLWKKGIRDCFFDANLSEKQFERVAQSIGKSYNLMEYAGLDEPDEIDGEAAPVDIRLPRNTLVIEADAAVHVDKGVRIIEHEGASGGKAIDSLRGARAIHEIYIPKTGRWYVWLRVLFDSGRKDSYWVGMDDAKAHPWNQEGGPGAIKIYAEPGDSKKWRRWLWDSGIDNIHGISPCFFHVKQTGYYQLWSKGREPGSCLDQICLTRSRNFNPEIASDGKPLPVMRAPHPYEPISVHESQKLIRHAVDIATAVNTELPWEFQYWVHDMWGDISKFPKTEGSLYKCPKCGEELPRQAVELMIQHAQSDDIQFYILCRKCGGEFD